MMRLVTPFSSSSISCRERSGLNTYPFARCPLFFHAAFRVFGTRSENQADASRSEAARRRRGRLSRPLRRRQKTRHCNVWCNPIAFDLSSLRANIGCYRHNSAIAEKACCASRYQPSRRFGAYNYCEAVLLRKVSKHFRSSCRVLVYENHGAPW